MVRFKQALLALFAAASCTAAYSQREEPIRLGIEAGPSFNQYTGSGRESLAGGFFGVRGEFDISKHAYLAGSLRYIMKGADQGQTWADWYAPGYVELPLAIGGYKQIGRHLGIFAETGPYFAIGTGGKAYRPTESEDRPWHLWFDDEDMPFYSAANGRPRRFDMGWGGQAGFAFRHFRLTLSYEIGFLPVWKKGMSPSGSGSYRNSSFLIGFSYLFY